ncbi:hypothetical protein CAPTEDRAFT_193455 [Capitella teleta]|uniref:Uncharacterized protein n=1 Tax=Capitella teleta TaxID=283909 RepID=R7U1G1_CAPTE|nr:hypothetical protein CAPTEDRAFT_193455 [Capitella teleta]|eukprot:ELT97496.1 hypothetical protein CAPTEDRAFT_193455 [Capitella teleta]
MLFATICATFCALRVNNTIQANETPMIRLKDVHTTPLAQIGFFLQSPMTAAVYWGFSELRPFIIAPNENHAEYTRAVSRFAIGHFQVILSDSSGNRGSIFFWLRSSDHEPTHFGTFSLFSDSPNRAMLRQGEEFVMNLIAERSVPSNASSNGSLWMYGTLNTFGSFAAHALEVGTDITRKYNDQVQCHISTKQKPENTVRVEAKCYITGVPIGNTDHYKIAIRIERAHFAVGAEIEGHF